MRYYLILLLLFARAACAVNACPQTSGALTLSCSTSRTTGISPLLVFYDCTATTDSSLTSPNQSVDQDVVFQWNFGDSGLSGRGNWAYGARTAYTSKNVATGIVGAHLYITSGTNSTVTATVRASDGTNTAQCTPPSVTVTDPVNGFAGATTVCVFNSTVGSNCPAGATQTTASTFSAPLAGSLSGKRVLFKCGDTFTGDNVTISGNVWSIGAYGGCENTTTNRPIFNDTGTSEHLELSTSGNTDGRIADIDFESTSATANGAWAGKAFTPTGYSQITTYNILSNNGHQFLNWNQGTQMGVIGSSHPLGTTNQITLFVNYNENNCVNGSTALNCGGTPNFTNTDYTAVIGNSVYGCNGCGGGVETIRVSSCRMCVFENNTIDASSALGSKLKFHSGNTYQTLGPWIGKYNEHFVITDNYSGNLGDGGLEVAPQNGVTDERLRFGLFSRNVMYGNSNQQGYSLCWLSAQNVTFSLNLFNMISSASLYPGEGCQVNTRGGNTFAFTSQYLEVYNNTGIVTGTAQGGQNLFSANAGGGFTNPNNSVFKNNMFFISNGGAAVNIAGTGNTISNNSSPTTANPGFTNYSGGLNQPTDFKPTANYTGGVALASVPYDALGQPTGTDLGAVHH
jgi:hypothetical protein